MSKSDLIATRDFTYMTRRLKAGDTFPARNATEAKILTRVRGVAEVPPSEKIIEAADVIDHGPDAPLDIVPAPAKVASAKPAAKPRAKRKTKRKAKK